MSDYKYHSLLGMLNQIYTGDSILSPQELERRVSEAYRNDEITGTQYDHLMGNLQELL